MNHSLDVRLSFTDVHPPVILSDHTIGFKSHLILGDRVAKYLTYPDISSLQI